MMNEKEKQHYHVFAEYNPHTQKEEMVLRDVRVEYINYFVNGITGMLDAKEYHSSDVYGQYPTE